MSFQLIEYQTNNPEYTQYNGRLAITLGWEAPGERPETERYIIITPLKADEYNLNAQETRCDGNCITFDHHSWVSRRTFDTTNMVKFTEREPVKQPSSRKNKYGERPVYTWTYGKWYIDHYAQED